MKTRRWMAMIVVLLGLMATTSCRPSRESKNLPEPTNASVGATSYATGDSPTGAVGEPQDVVREDAILGTPPKPVVRKVEVERANFSVKVGDTYHDAKELAALALRYVENTDKNIITNRISIHVILLVDSKDLLAEVGIGSGIGKPCWTVTITKRLKVHSCKRGVGQG